ncbi:MAG: anti-sigma factor [Bacteroidota bacterium]|nr:anti-sigma factor [Bacteroidota bacterium]
MTKEEFILSGLLELYAMGISSPEETQIVQEHLDRFPELKQELKETEIALENYALSNSTQPAPSVKEKLFNQLFSGDEKNPLNMAPVVSMTKKSFVPLFYKSIAAAVFILLIGSMVLNYSYFNKYHKAQDALDLAQQQLQQKEKSNAAMTHDLSVVTNKYAMPVVLNGTPHAPDALAKIFWMKNTGQVYIDPSNLPKVPSGMQYQLWGIVDGKPVSGGMIETSKGIYHIQKMKSFGKVDAFAITLEKAGGSPTPTMDQMIVSAKM